MAGVQRWDAGPSSCPYSPELVAGVFSEVRRIPDVSEYAVTESILVEADTLREERRLGEHHRHGQEKAEGDHRYIKR
jgi:hypothetical protein